jgi:CBS domain-containing protein
MKSLKQLLAAKGNQVYSIGPNAKVIEALQLMAQKDVGALAVMESGRLMGMISERDYARKVILHGRSSQDVPVRDIMTADVITISPDETIEQCMALVTQRRIRHLPVCEGEKLIGLVSIGDLVKEVIADQEQTIKQLESYIHS